MAKSQYTDSITGEVLSDIRVIDDKAVDISSSKCYSLYRSDNVSLSSSYTKYSNKSILISGNQQSFRLFKKQFNLLNLKNFTLSFWYNLSGIQSHNNNVSVGFYFIAVQFLNSNGANCFYIVLDEASGWEQSYRHLKIDKDGNRTFIGGTNSMTALNTWHHHAVTYNGTTYKVYDNGTQIISANSSASLSPYTIDNINFVIGKASELSNTKFYIDDAVLINNQILWTGNFDVPNYYLTGDHNIKRASNKNMIYPKPTDRNDYFDKAFIY